MTAPVHRLKKTEIIWLAKHKCKHRHPYLNHYSCYLEEHPNTTRRGFFDIETTHLKGNFGMILTYCILDDASGRIDGRTITRREILDSKTRDKKVVGQLIKDLGNYDEIVTFYGCMAPGNKVLRSNLQWDKVENIKAGDKLLSFEAEIPQGGKFRWYNEATVLHNNPVERPCVEITTSDGDEIVCTKDHPFLVQRGSIWSWRSADKLLHFNGNNEIQTILPTWDSMSSYDAGYIAAFLDGEGCLTQIRKTDRPYNNFGLQISFSQKDVLIIDKFTGILKRNGYKFSVSQYDKNHPHQKRIEILGGRAEKLRLLGQTSPAKLSRLELSKLGRIFKHADKKIINIRDIGNHTVMGLGTTTQTYISNGFCSHNTRFDIPFSRTRALIHGLDFPTYGTLKHKDAYYMVRYKFSLHSNRLENACRTLCGSTNKTSLIPDIWQRAQYGDTKALDYIVDHCREDVKDLKRLYYRVLEYAYPGVRAV